MAVLIRHRAEGMTASVYDEIAPPLVEKLKTQPGFVIHVSYEEDGGGLVVAEVWESQAQHDEWFDQNVKPNLQGDVQQEVIDLHSVHTP
jgi:heme-degrading monooxygenase HmoA